MRFLTIASFSAVLGLAAAHASDNTKRAVPPIDRSCDAHAVVSQCLLQFTPRYDNCPGGDFKCQCLAARDIQECFINCPKDANRVGWDSIVLNCNAHFPSSTATPSSTSTGSTSTSTSTSASTTTTTSSSSESSSPSSSPSPSPSSAEVDSEGDASSLGPAAGLMGFVMAAVALL